MTTAGGRRLGAFVIEGPLGRGGMGAVFRARDAALDRVVALKVLAAPSSDRRRVERFVREGRLAAALDHPNVVRVFGAGHEAGSFYLAMELVEGGSLADLARRTGRLPVATACRLVRDAARAVAAAHALGIVHRDLKPDNVLVTARGEVKVADFGLARDALGPRITGTGQFLGTPLYAAPEQCAGQEVGPAADIYSLGAMLYELLAGTPPLDAPTPFELFHKVAHEAPRPLGHLRPDVPRALADLVARCLAKDPAARLARAADLAAGLEPYVTAPGGAPVTTQPAAPSPRPPLADTADPAPSSADHPEAPPSARPSARRRVALAALSGAGVALLIVAAVVAVHAARARPVQVPVQVTGWQLATDDAELAWLVDAIPAFVEAELRAAQVPSPRQRRGAPAALAPAAAWRVGSRLYVSGGQVAVATEVVAPDGAQASRRVVVFAREDVLERLAELARDVRETVTSGPARMTALSGPASPRGQKDGERRARPDPATTTESRAAPPPGDPVDLRRASAALGPPGVEEGPAERASPTDGELAPDAAEFVAGEPPPPAREDARWALARAVIEAVRRGDPAARVAVRQRLDALPPADRAAFAALRARLDEAP